MQGKAQLNNKYSGLGHFFCGMMLCSFQDNILHLALITEEIIRIEFYRCKFVFAANEMSITIKSNLPHVNNGKDCRSDCTLLLILKQHYTSAPLHFREKYAPPYLSDSFSY